MKSELMQLREGVIGFEEFVRATRVEWERLASKLFKTYPSIPDGVEVGDLVQEMLIAAWTKALDWNPKFGSDLRTYVTWSAYAAAKRWLNGQRNSLRRADNTPGRYPISESRLFRGDEAGLDCGIGGLNPVIPLDEQYDARMVFTQLLCDLDDRQSMVLEMWADSGSVDQTVARIESDAELAEVLKVSNRRSVRRLVASTITTACEAVATLD